MFFPIFVTQSLAIESFGLLHYFVGEWEENKKKKLKDQ